MTPGPTLHAPELRGKQKRGHLLMIPVLNRFFSIKTATTPRFCQILT